MCNININTFHISIRKVKSIDNDVTHRKIYTTIIKILAIFILLNMANFLLISCLLTVFFKCSFCYRSNLNKFQISQQRTDLIRQKSFSFLKMF